MAANAEKTIEYSFPTRTTSLGTGTSLAASARWDTTTQTLTIPENGSRTFKSVMAQVNWRDYYGTVYNVSGWRIGITCGSIAASDVDYSPTAQANTGDHESGIVVRDVTDYFNTNFGAGRTQTASIGFAMATATAASVCNLNAKLIITYEYDTTSASTMVKTVRIPIQSASALLRGGICDELGTGGTGAAPANQIPALDTFLPETGKSYKNIAFEIFANDGGAAVTNFNSYYQIDTGGSVSGAILNQALNTGTFFYDDWLIKYYDVTNSPVTPYAMTTNAVHAFKMGSSLTNRFDAAGGFMRVTYECDTSSSIVMNSLILPVDTNPGYVAATSASNANYMGRELWIEEPDTISIKQSGVLFYVQSPGGATFNVAADTQTVRPYTLTALVNSGGHAVVHRGDCNSGAWTLARGKNTMNIKAYTSAAAAANCLVGLALINYTSGSAYAGSHTHNHTTQWLIKEQASSGAVATTNDILGSTARTPSIIPIYYFLNGVAYELMSRWGAATNSITLNAERLAGEFNGDGWQNIDAWISTNDGELASYMQIAAGLDSFDRDRYQIGKMDIETPRNYTLSYTTAALYWLRMYLTYHSIQFYATGSLSGPSGDGSGVEVDFYRTTDNAWSGSTVTSPSGSFVFITSEGVYPLFASVSQDATHIGRSGSALTSASLSTQGLS